MEKLELPEAPAHLSGPVKAWSQPVAIPTYAPMAADPNPMFLESRVYQGSSGRVYPLPFIDRIASEPKVQEWQALHLENEFIRLMILPEIGGRIHVGLDKINGYDFFYRQNVIKPALVGLAGPWISGGVEFNWPQHHRPTTFMPVNTEIETHADGAITIWCSDHDPMERMRGTHGICLHAGRAVIEVKVRLFNRTPYTQSFLWWANVATHVNESYQSLFPPDVQSVVDHARRAVTSFPLCKDIYYGIDYGARAGAGIPLDQQPSQYVPKGDYPPNDLSRYANIPVPTSYMGIGSRYDFLAGYDHGRKAGVVHVADHHISPGKKQWTWGNHDFGYAWDRNLTDADGPYIELMAGVYTDNQPDFSFLGPFETKTFSQYWFPIRDLSGIQQANVDAAVSLRRVNDALEVAVNVTKAFPQAKITVTDSGTHPLAEWIVDLSPTHPFQESILTQTANGILTVLDRNGSEIVKFDPSATQQSTSPELATEAPMPQQITSQDELYLTGLHLQQYRHATRKPEIYWQEALRRDPADSRCNTAMGSFHLRRGEFELAEKYLRQALTTLTRRNHNPADGEPFYLLGLTLRFLGDFEGAYAAFYKATWNHAWIAAGYLALAEIDADRQHWAKAFDHISRSLAYNAENFNARNLKAILLRKLNRSSEAATLLEESLRLDPLDPWSRHLAGAAMAFPNQQLLDLALDYARAGLFSESVRVLETINNSATDGSIPICLYALASFLDRTGDSKRASEVRSCAKIAPPAYCFPSRLEELQLLKEQVDRDPHDPRALYYLGNLLYDKRRHTEAIEFWRRSANLDPEFPTVWRNLGFGYFNILHNQAAALEVFDKAFAVDPDDARVFFERDQLLKRVGRPPRERLNELERFPNLVNRRDDLSVELATLYNQTGQPKKALTLLSSRHFQPWEGGEGLTIAQYVRAHLALGRIAFSRHRFAEALRHFQTALQIPKNLSEARHVLANRSNVYYWLGLACEAARNQSAAVEWWSRAVSSSGDFQQMSVRPFSEMTFYTVMSLDQLGLTRERMRLTTDLSKYASRLAREKAEIDYFATSLPTMLLFDDDLQKRQKLIASVLQAQADLLEGEIVKAARAFRRILRADPSHEIAFDMLEELPLHREHRMNAQASIDA